MKEKIERFWEIWDENREEIAKEILYHIFFQPYNTNIWLTANGKVFITPSNTYWQNTEDIVGHWRATNISNMDTRSIIDEEYLKSEGWIKIDGVWYSPEKKKIGSIYQVIEYLWDDLEFPDEILQLERDIENYIERKEV